MPVACHFHFWSRWSCHLDYCNSLLYGVADNVTRKVQSLQNAAAHLTTGARRRDHITPVLCQLHWLPVRRRVEFKLACLVRQVLCGQMPIYLADNIHLVSESNRRSLRSSSHNMWAVTRCHVRTTTLETEALALSARTLDISYKHFKTLYVSTRPRRFVTFYIRALEIRLLAHSLTYRARCISCKAARSFCSQSLCHLLSFPRTSYGKLRG